MEVIRDTELVIVGERYRGFSEAYRVNDSRPLNELYADVGDGSAQVLFEADAGVLFSAQDTRKALLYGSDIYDERFKAARADAVRILHDRYEWMREPASRADVHGQNVIVERFAAGHPEAFSRKRATPRNKRSVQILYDGMCSASTSVDKRVQAGCCVLAAAEALERLGYEVAITYVLAKFSGQRAATDPTLVVEVELKDYGEPLNAKRMQFALAAKPVLFHFGCWWAHRFPHTPLNYGEGEGYPVSYEKKRLGAMQEHARNLRGVYLSEDVVELRLHGDVVEVLEQVLRDIGDSDILEAYMRPATPISAAVQPEQGRMFCGWNPSDDGEDMQGEAVGAQPSQPTDAPVPSSVGTHSCAPSQATDAPQGAQECAPTPGGTGDVASAPDGTGDASDTPSGTSDAGEIVGARFIAPAQPTDTTDGNSMDRESETPTDTQDSGAGNGEEDDSMSQDEVLDLSLVDDEDEQAQAEPDLPTPDDLDFEADPFIVELRKRFVRFENGEYLKLAIDDKMARRQAAKTATQDGQGTPLAPPVPNQVRESQPSPMGSPRNTPFSMSYL